jgi:hypothetical protein
MEFDVSKLPISFAYSQADVSSFFTNITAKGGALFIIGPLAINSTGSPLDSIPARTMVFGIGEIDWTTSSSGTVGFSWGIDSVTANIYFHENSNYYYATWHTDQVNLLARFWTNFPSQGGALTGTPTFEFDGNVNLGKVGSLTNILNLLTIYNGSLAERVRLEVGSAGNRGAIRLWDATLAAFRYAYIDNGVWVIQAGEPT